MDNSIKKEVEKQPVKVDLIKVSDYQKKGTKTAQLRQVIKTRAWYQAIQISNDMEQNVFSHEEFGEVAEPSHYDSTENRVCFLTVPEKVTAEEVQKKIDAVPDACIYKVMSNHPILTTSQQYAIDNPELPITLNRIANKQVVRYPKGHDLEGSIVTDSNGKVQYRATFFAKEHVEDMDRRNDDLDDQYTTPEILVELGHSVPDEEQIQFEGESEADTSGQNA